MIPARLVRVMNGRWNGVAAKLTMALGLDQSGRINQALVTVWSFHHRQDEEDR